MVNLVVQYPPAAPGSISLPAESYTGAYRLGWNAVASAGRYEVEESINGGVWAQVANHSALAQDFSGRPAAAYSYRLRVCNAVGGCGPYSNTVVISVIFPPQPLVLGPAVANDSGGYVLSWAAVATATKYRIEKSSNGGLWVSAQYAEYLSATLRGLEAGSYSFRGQACNAAGCSGYSNIVGLTIAPAPIPPTPMILESTKYQWYVGTQLKVRCTVRWTVAQGATSYNLKVPATGIVQYSGVATEVMQVGGGYCGTSHVVQACNATGCSAYSAPPFYQSVDNGL